MKGYKVFKPDWTCRGFKYKVGSTYEMEGKPLCCERGFHFCRELKDCFNYYSFDPDNKVAVVEVLGDVDIESDKSCTNKIMIVEEVTWEEVLQLVNLGKGCSGFCNTGNYNTGDRNTGFCNTGNCNTGNYNTGNYNTGNWNTGNWNTGDYNTGNWNTGNWNTGDYNTGNCNTGNCNTGFCNIGEYNTGDWNTGDWNTGDYNTGDWNTTSFSSGVFNTEEGKILMFNKPSNWSYRDWLNSRARCLLNQINQKLLEWVWSSDMTDQEKEDHPEHTTTGGYLRILDESECAQKWWDSLSPEDKCVIAELPNFDVKIFEKITGIKTDEEFLRRAKK